MDVHEAINSAIEEIKKAHSVIGREKSSQIKTKEQKQYIQSIVYSWKKRYCPIVAKNISTEDIQKVNTEYTKVLEITERDAAKSTYLINLENAKNSLIRLRSTIFVNPITASSQTPDPPPDFTSLASDPAMQAILIRRWEECKKCLTIEASLAATVMMGGLLEALFVSKANKMKDKTLLFKVKCVPINPKTKKPLDLKDWTLGSYIDVGRELGWISQSGKDVADVLREYRNYIHPEKERSHGVILKPEDARMFWEITKSLARQLLTSL